MILSINNSVNIQCYVYAEFAVHNDMRSHNIGFPTMGTGGSYVQSRKYKMITKSSTGANLVRLDDFLTQVIWTQYFLKDKGYKIRDNIIYQDNQIAMKLENNCRPSSSNMTRNINIRYYFITDRITKQEESV